MSFPSDLEIARSVTPRPIADVAHELGFRDDEIELYGSHKAKITIEGIERKEREHGRGKYVLVTAISPTPLGEGKTHHDRRPRPGPPCGSARRRPSPSASRRSARCSGSRAAPRAAATRQVIPMEDFNLHLTGDVHAIGAAHNLAAAFIDNHIHHGNELGIDANNVLWPRVMDISDRALRDIVVGLGGKDNGYPRQGSFVITVASEVMAILALASDLKDLRARLGRIVLATKKDGTPITAEDLKVAGSMAVLLKDALKPNLMQTLEGGPAFVHCGPFANIAHGNNSILADRAALAGSDIRRHRGGLRRRHGRREVLRHQVPGVGADAATPR